MRVHLFIEYEKSLKKVGDTGISNGVEMWRLGLEKNGVEIIDDLDGDYDLIDIYPVAFIEANHVLKKAKKMGKKVVVHAYTTPYNFRNSFWFANYIGPVIDHQMVKLFNNADAVVCVAGHMKRSLAEAGVTNEMVVVENTMDPEKFTGGERDKYRKRFGLEGVVPFCTGLVIPRKGIVTFSNVAGMMPGTKFIWYGLIGKGIMTSFKGKGIVKNASPNLVFPGYVDDIRAAYASGDILFFPTYNENFSLTYLEALMTGKPSVVRDIPAFDFVQDGTECMKAKTDQEFVEKLTLLIDDDRLRKGMASAAKSKGMQYTPQNIGAKLRSVYERVLAG